MTDQTTLEKHFAGWFLARLNVEVLAETDLFETGVLDSLGFVELMLHLEQEFGVTLALEQVEIDNFRSVERIAAFLLGAGAAHLNPRAAEGS